MQQRPRPNRPMLWNFGVLLLVIATGCQDANPETAASSSTEPTAATRAKPLETEREKTLYYLGASGAQSIADLQLDPEESEIIQQGFLDALRGVSTSLDPEVYQPLVIQLIREQRQALVQRNKIASAAFVAEQGKRPGAQTTESGLVFISTQEGSGAAPTATDTVRVHYHGTLRDGRVFDSSIERGSPATLSLNGVIPCWTEGLTLMKEGGKATLVCPPDLAYGDNPTGSIPGGSALLFEVELLEIPSADNN